jgi:hypothetical protein
MATSGAYAKKRRASLLRSLSTILDHIRTFPEDYRPELDDGIPSGPYSNHSDERTAAEAIFRRHYSQWPPTVLSQFMALSFMLANESALAGEDHPHLDGTYIKPKKPTGSEQSVILESLMLGRGSLRPVAMADPIIRAKLRYVTRHFSKYAPYENLIYTFLGSAAFDYFNLSSQEGAPKVQPHEASREEWIDLYRIDTQVRIDLELTTLAALDADQARDLVGAAWAIAALMSHLSPSVFMIEAEPYVSSTRQSSLTVSSGYNTRVLLRFRAGSFRNVLKFLQDCIAEPAFDAADLMWIAHALAAVDTVDVPYGSEQRQSAPSYRLFLSHRGADAKTDLLERLIAHDAKESVFLDCLSLANGSINRLFVYQSLVRSREAFLIETSNYAKSRWCLKEKRLAEYLHAAGILRTRTFRSVDAAWRAFDDTPAQALPAHENGHGNDDDDVSPGPMWFLYSDFHKTDRAPNAHTLQSHPHFLARVDEVMSRLHDRIESAASDWTSFASLVNTAALSLFDSIVEGARTARLKDLGTLPVDPIIAFAQLAFCMVSIGTTTTNKVESRQAADQLARLMVEFVDLTAESETGCENELAFPYLFTMIVAAALEFDRTGRNPLPSEAGRRSLAGAAMIRRRHVVFDVREDSAATRFHLRLAALLTRHGIGTVAIAQSASRMVHEQSIDGFDLSVLPCMTIYPAMAKFLDL